LILRGPDGFPQPALRFEPEQRNGNVVLLLDGRGKAAELLPDGEIARLLAAGHPVLAVDLRGFGETETRAWRFPGDHFGNNAAEFFLAYQLGDSLVAARARDALVAADAAGEGAKVLAIGEAVVPALHAAAAMPGRFSSVEIRDGMRSWREAIDAEVTRGLLESLVHGAFARYDLDHLARICGAIEVER
jgi:pimeloyl-ACP methyl ester carboxylesterase